jgi:hypothetical protein
LAEQELQIARKRMKERVVYDEENLQVLLGGLSRRDILNQKDECVAEMEGYGMFRRRSVQDA